MVNLIIMLLNSYCCRITCNLFSQDICNPDGKFLQNILLNVMIGVACLGITTVMFTWAFTSYGFYKHKSEFKIQLEIDLIFNTSNGRKGKLSQ